MLSKECVVRFGIADQIASKGLLATPCFALEDIFVYQLALLYRFEQDLELCVGLKLFSRRPEHL
jgi:hypothetical protein